MNNLVKVMALVVLGSIGCGEKSPADKCEDFVSTVCDRAVDCIAGAAGMHDDCVQSVHQAFSCSETKSVGQSYDDCIDQLNEQSCSTLFPPDSQTGDAMLNLPNSCLGVLMTQAARGEPTPVLRTPTMSRIFKDNQTVWRREPEAR
jgi:hypothetical protein